MVINLETTFDIADGRMDGQTDRRMNKVPHRVVRLRLKMDCQVVEDIIEKDHNII